MGTAKVAALAVCEGLSNIADLDQSLLAMAFRGDLVPQDSADEPASVLLEQLRTAQVDAFANDSPGRKIRNQRTQAKTRDLPGT